jgi:putative transposase
VVTKAMSNPFRHFNSSPEVIRLVVMLYVRYPLPLRNVEDLLAERGIDISHETVRFWWNRFGPMFAAEIRKRRVAHMRGYPQWRWHLDEVFVKVNGKLCYCGAPLTMRAKSWKRWFPRSGTKPRR